MLSYLLYYLSRGGAYLHAKLRWRWCVPANCPDNTMYLLILVQVMRNAVYMVNPLPMVSSI